MLNHISVLPFHPARLWIHANQLTIARSNEQSAVPVGHRREIELLRQQPVLVPIPGQRVFLPAGNITVKTFVVSLHPDISLRVDVEPINAATYAVYL